MTAALMAAPLDAAARGWAAFPVQPGGKRPAVDSWEQRATSSRGAIERHWPAGANVGIACGPSRLVVVDLDSAAHGDMPRPWAARGCRDGVDVLAAIADDLGEPWPGTTYTVATPSGGYHFYFVAPDASIRNSAGRIGPRVDVRAAGGFVVGVGSVVNGKTYRRTHSGEPEPLPAWLLELATRQPPPPRRPAPVALVDPVSRYRRLAGLVQAVLDAPVGQRNSVLNWAAHTARDVVASGAPHADVAEAFTAAGLAAGLDEPEVRATVRSGLGATL